MIVLVAGANGRLGGLVVALLLGRGHAVRGLVRKQEEVGALEEIGASALVGDLRGDVEWAAAGCDAAVFAAAPRRPGVARGGGRRRRRQAGRGRRSLRAAALRVVQRRRGRRARPPHGCGARVPRGEALRRAPAGAARHAVDHPPLWPPHRRDRHGPDRHGAAARRAADPEPGRRRAGGGGGARARPPRPPGRARGGRRAPRVADALDAIEPLPPPPVRPTGLGAGQTSNPPPDPDMLAPDASPLDADVEFEGDGPLPPELVGNEDPAPGIP